MASVENRNFTKEHHLMIGGCDTVALAEQYGTPLFVYDVALIRERARGFKQTFEELGVAHRVVYASKAFTSIALYQLLNKEGLSFDVVSAGELFAALKAGVPAENIEFHGNNKTVDELEMAIEHNVGTIVVDNFYELKLLEELLSSSNKQQTILLRISPGVEAHTHAYISTGQEDTKFGFDLNSGQADEAFLLAQNSPCFELAGIHCHIGSQIFTTEGFKGAAKIMMNLLIKWQQETGYEARVLNIGGGFGVTYTEDDTPLPPEEYVKEIIKVIQQLSKDGRYPLPEIWIEPGRSIVGEAGTTLYTVGARKEIPNVRTFVSVDGGMGDNIRPALYQAKYDALLANRKSDEEETVTITGKYCETGDVLIENITLPVLQPGDLLAMLTTGAYGYSMATNYNKNPRPAVVFVENGESRLAIRRETYEDMLKLDIP